MRNDLIIVDEEYIAFANLIQSIGIAADKKMSTLIDQLRIVALEGIIDGNVHDNLAMYIDKLVELYLQLNIYTEEIHDEILEFLDEVEKEDCSIYEGGRLDGWN